MAMRSAPIRPGSPCVAVIVPAYNAKATISRTISSALDQAEVAELVVVDDGSVDGTGEMARACDDGTGRLRIVRQANAGPSAACNRGVALSRAPVWCVLDADDVFAPRRLEVLLGEVGADWDMAADPLLFRFPEGDVRGLAPGPGQVRRITFESFVRENIPRRKRPRRELGFLQPLMRRAFFDEHRLGWDLQARFAEDYMLYAAALARGARFLWASGPGYVVHVTAGSLSHSQTAADYDRVIAFDRTLMGGRAGGELRALRGHIHLMRLKAEYLRIEDDLARGRALAALGRTLRDPATAGFMFNHHWRPGLARSVKRLAALDPGRDLLDQLLPRLNRSRMGEPALSPGTDRAS